MFVIIPWQVDVPRVRWPVANWLIMLATVIVFVVQVSEWIEYADQQDRVVVETTDGEPVVRRAEGDGDRQTLPGITGALMLDGWGVAGLFGYMWLHGGLWHLLGNMLFLWIFGNAVCAKVGNLQYVALYVLLGVAAGVAHVLSGGGTAVGASGAINGVVGMYLVLFPENDITCIFWFLLVIVRRFTVSSFWMIGFWLVWDVLGVFCGGADAGIAYYAHVGGFASGFGVAWLMCYTGWVTMEVYEKSLLQMWQGRRQRAAKGGLNPAYGEYARWVQKQDYQGKESAAPGRELPAVSADGATEEKTAPPAAQVFIHVACSCGKAIKVPQRYAGRSGRCPHCKAKVRIPGESSPAAPVKAGSDGAKAASRRVGERCIRFVCACGYRIKAPAKYAGRWGTCPGCKARIKVPEAP